MWGFVVLVVLLVALFKWLRRTGPDQPVRGCVFVTGCDSGMGETTAFHLAKTGFHVFAACFTNEGVVKYADNPKITAVQLDVSSEEQVNAAAQWVEKQMAERKLGGLFGVLQCAGIAFTAPFEYIPIASFKRQIDVNFYGYVYVAKAFLPLLKRSAMPDRRGRICFVSSGPLPGPGVPFITSYLAAKWAGEAVIQGLQFEFALRELSIDCVVLSPGVVKPTRLAAEGLALLEKTFKEMPPVSNIFFFF
jgi:NAD(P)-dependent dehydrogenase (short-subunit alcohol dehydrogenase family)